MTGGTKRKQTEWPQAEAALLALAPKHGAILTTLNFPLKATPDKRSMLAYVPNSKGWGILSPSWGRRGPWSRGWHLNWENGSTKDNHPRAI